MKAMILSAGRGQRMRPLTDHTPKPMLIAGGKPLIVWHLERLARAGFREVVINTAHLGDQISAALQTGAQWGINIRYSPEHEGALETAGGIATAQPWDAPEDPFLLLNGDIFSDWDLAEAWQIAASKRLGLGHLVLVNNPAHHPGGDFGLQPDGLVGPLGSTPVSLTFSGQSILRGTLFHATRPNHRAALAPLLQSAIREGQIAGSHHCGHWVDVGTPDRLAALDHTLLRGRPWLP